ncbi:hypothetical protein [Paenibacillus roseipurpureus]|uniref:Uncharacterized protein n=1 Tax=Paenibacillus roseopurpureus TaxID=2918901 RepID=A0AA96LNR7_9BACL|nr:hypothetical protein [Paenibacillus sp. MBLB1832]WNR43224.1 hypothetical protein MJB10_19210 [Paenibacillus sp. MBLB1832]
MDIDAFLAEVLSSNEDWHVSTMDTVTVIDPIIAKDNPDFDPYEEYQASEF